MKKTLLLLVLAVLVLEDVSAQEKIITTFILVRHAEKANDGTDDPDLKPEGYERAGRLAALLKNTAVSAVYSTRYKRTKNTVAPLAKQNAIDVRIYDAAKPEVLEDIIRHEGGIVVICGHSNTIPQIANLLTGNKDYLKTFPDTEYGNILIIPVFEPGKAGRINWLNY